MGIKIREVVANDYTEVVFFMERCTWNSQC